MSDTSSPDTASGGLAGPSEDQGWFQLHDGTVLRAADVPCSERATATRLTANQVERYLTTMRANGESKQTRASADQVQDVAMPE